MNKIKCFLMLSGYQITWLSCVLGEVFYKSFIPGLLFGFIFLLIGFFYTNYKKNFVLILFFISIPGYLFDSILVYFKVYNFNTSDYLGFLPIWMLVLWPSFASLFNEVFTFLYKYKLSAVFFGSVLGPLTYYSGYPLGLININQFYLFFLFMITFWGMLMIYYLNYLIKFKFD